jgi:hypothetical protein
MYVIQWGLLVSCALSSITGIAGVFDAEGTLKKFFGESAPQGPMFKWNFRMQFLSLLIVYSLNIVVALAVPLPTLAYTLACLNLVRVAYVSQYIVNAEKLAMMGLQENVRGMPCHARAGRHKIPLPVSPAPLCPIC